jgi:hypothetical protein
VFFSSIVLLYVVWKKLLKQINWWHSVASEHIIICKYYTGLYVENKTGQEHQIPKTTCQHHRKITYN